MKTVIDKKVIVDFLESDAERTLKLWLRDRKTQITHYFSCARFHYASKPFWAIVVRLFSWESGFNGIYGFHIYEDGEVKLVSRQPE